MFQPPTIRAMDAARKRFDQLVALYPGVKGEDAKRLYSDSLAANQSLVYALGGPHGLQEALNTLVDRQTGLVQQAVKGQEQLLAQFRRQADAAQAADDPTTAGIHRDGALLSLAVAGVAFKSAALTRETTQHILTLADITCLGVVALVEASDRHYESEAIKRFRSLVLGLVRDAVDPFEVVGSTWECLVALSDVLRARIKDAKAADDVFIRERSFQQMTHLAGLQVEQLTLIINASLDASTKGASARVVSMEQAVKAWEARLEEANRQLGR